MVRTCPACDQADLNPCSWLPVFKSTIVGLSCTQADRATQSILWADRLNVMMATVHAQSEAQDGSLARLAVNNSVIARCFCGGQFDFKEGDPVGLDASHPHRGTTKVKLVHVEERVHPCLPEGLP